MKLLYGQQDKIFTVACDLIDSTDTLDWKKKHNYYIIHMYWYGRSKVCSLGRGANLFLVKCVLCWPSLPEIGNLYGMLIEHFYGLAVA